MHSWKKKLVVSQLALACTLAITSQANAANYDTWGYHDNTTTDLVWPYDTDNDGIADAGGMDPMGSDGNYVTYNGFVYYNNANGDFDTVFKGGFAPIFPDICYHLTHYKPAAAEIFPWRAITQRTMRMPFVIMLERLCKVLCCR